MSWFRKNSSVIAAVCAIISVVIITTGVIYGVGRWTATTEIQNQIPDKNAELRAELTTQMTNHFAIIEKQIATEFDLIRAELVAER